MTLDITSLLENYGIPLVILLLLGAFIDRRVWPWVKELISKQLDQSHKLVVEERGKTQKALDSMSKSLELMSKALLEQQLSMTSSMDRMTREFSEVIREIHKGGNSGDSE